MRINYAPFFQLLSVFSLTDNIFAAFLREPNFCNAHLLSS